MSYDSTEFNKFRQRFGRFTKEFERWLLNFIHQEGLRFVANAKLRTPVDTGDLRNHWAVQGVSRVGDELHVIVVNPMNYASFVEYGHAKPYKAGASEGSSDWVDGYFMMTVSIDKIQRTMPARFGKEFRAFLRGFGI